MSQTIELRVPDIGDYKDVPVIELLVAVGDTIAVDTPLVTLESDKATMDVPSTAAGRVTEILIKTGDRVGEGSVIARLEATDAVSPPAAAEAMPLAEPVSEPITDAVAPPAAVSALPHATPIAALSTTPAPGGVAHGPCGPSVRRLARQLGVDLAKVVGSGAKGTHLPG